LISSSDARQTADNKRTATNAVRDLISFVQCILRLLVSIRLQLQRQSETCEKWQNENNTIAHQTPNTVSLKPKTKGNNSFVHTRIRTQMEKGRSLNVGRVTNASPTEKILAAGLAR
jgi:hypothetical protein